MTHQEFIDFLQKLTSIPSGERTEFVQLSIQLPTHERKRIADHLIRLNAEMAQNDATFAAQQKAMKQQISDIEKNDIPAFAALLKP